MFRPARVESAEMLRRTVTLIAALLMLSAAACGSDQPSPTPTQSADVTADTDADRGAIVFLPGLAGSELSCGASGNQENLWPGVQRLGVFNKQNFGALGLVNTIDGDAVRSQATSSQPCGSKPFRGGTVAQYPPIASSVAWCLPEPASGLPPQPHTCKRFEHGLYADFGNAVQAAADSQDRQFVPYPWDWRLRPQDQVADLHKVIESLQQDHNAKVTIVAHSFGNILFEYWKQYVRAQGKQAGDYVGRFVGAGSPWWGVATAWTHAAYGEIQPGLSSKVLSHVIGTKNVASTFSSAPGPYTLFPTRWYNDYINGSTGQPWLAASDGDASAWVAYRDVPGVIAGAMDKCPQQDTFPCMSAELYRSAGLEDVSRGFERDGIADWVQIVGAGEATAGQICHGCKDWPTSDEQQAVPGSDAPRGLTKEVNGDLNVPVFSAIRGDDPENPPGDKVDFFFTCGVSHMGLVNDAAVRDELIPYLLGDADLGYGGSFSRTPCALSDGTS